MPNWPRWVRDNALSLSFMIMIIKHFKVGDDMLMTIKNIAKGTMDPRVEFISQVQTQILIKQFQNFDQALTSKSQPNISISTKLKLKILAKPSFIILTKIQLRNLNQTSAANLRILTKPCAQSLNKSLALCPNLSFKSATNCCQHDPHHQHQQQ